MKLHKAIPPGITWIHEKQSKKMHEKKYLRNVRKEVLMIDDETMADNAWLVQIVVDSDSSNDVH